VVGCLVATLVCFEYKKKKIHVCCWVSLLTEGVVQTCTLWLRFSFLLGRLCLLGAALGFQIFDWASLGLLYPFSGVDFD
jgi:hypothetical protein